jgi:hypothetical protein
MPAMDTAIATLLSPVILFFLLGVAAAFVRSDLAIPEAIAKGMSLYLMAAIGLKGGREVAAAGFSSDMLVAAALGVGLSLLLPLPAYALLRKFARLSPVDASACAGHYGSVSVVTFVTGVEVLTSSGMPPAGYMVAVLALMETPGLIVALMLARRVSAGTSPANTTGMLHEALFNGSVMLLMGSFVIGLISESAAHDSIKPLFDGLFRGVLCLFLLDMGLIAARRFLDARALTWRVGLLGIGFPLAFGTLGVLLGALAGLDAGTTAALGILAGSASYIAAPAVMRMALPQADPGLYLGMSLAVSFPFNIILGIPLFAAFARSISP